MKLTSRQDIEAPIDFLYAQLTDFDQFERMAMRRGAEVERRNPQHPAGAGLSWRLRFGYRGKPRQIDVTLLRLKEQTGLDYSLDSLVVGGSAQFDLLALSAKRTRLTAVVELKPKTLAARLMLQSLRLAKGRVQQKYDSAVSKLAYALDERWRAEPR